MANLKYEDITKLKELTDGCPIVKHEVDENGVYTKYLVYNNNGVYVKYPVDVVDTLDPLLNITIPSEQELIPYPTGAIKSNTKKDVFMNPGVSLREVDISTRANTRNPDISFNDLKSVLREHLLSNGRDSRFVDEPFFEEIIKAYVAGQNEKVGEMLKRVETVEKQIHENKQQMKLEVTELAYDLVDCCNNGVNSKTLLSNAVTLIEEIFKDGK